MKQLLMDYICSRVFTHMSNIEAENQTLKEGNKRLRQLLFSTQAENKALLERIKELEFGIDALTDEE